MSTAHIPANSLLQHQRVCAPLGLRARRHPSENRMNNVPELTTNEAKTVKTSCFPRADGSRIPYEVYSSPEIYELELERIFRGPTWSFVALEAEVPNPGDFKSTFVGATPVVVTRNEHGSLSVWVNPCAHRSARVCHKVYGNAQTY